MNDTITPDEALDSVVRWYAIDQNGDVGLFISDGTVVHPMALRSRKMLAACRLAILELSDTCSARRDQTVYGFILQYLNAKESRKIAGTVYKEYLRFAEKGCWVYSSFGPEIEIFDDSYVRTHIPSEPLTYTALPEDLQLYLSTIIFDLGFADTTVINSRDLSEHPK